MNLGGLYDNQYTGLEHYRNCYAFKYLIFQKLDTVRLVTLGIIRCALPLFKKTPTLTLLL